MPHKYLCLQKVSLCHIPPNDRMEGARKCYKDLLLTGSSSCCSVHFFLGPVFCLCTILFILLHLMQGCPFVPTKLVWMKLEMLLLFHSHPLSVSFILQLRVKPEPTADCIQLSLLILPSHVHNSRKLSCLICATCLRK